MKANHLILAILVLILVLESCDKESKEPYIIFKDSKAIELNQDTIEVEAVSNQELLIESYFDSSSPVYLREINNDSIIDISDSTDVNLTTHGYSGIEDLNFEKVVLSTYISNMDLTSGAIIRITVRVGSDCSKSIYYKLK